MIVYLVTSISLLILGLIYESFNSLAADLRRKKLPISFFIVPSFLILFVIFAFRGDFTTDYKNYSDLFNIYNRYGFWEVFKAGFQVEPGYIFLNKLFGIFTDDVIYLFMFTSFVILFGFYYHINKYSVNVWLSILLFVTAGSYYASFNITRQIFAVAIIFFGSGFLYERKFFKFLFFVILASLFHKTSLIMIPFYFILNFRLKLRNWVLIIISSGVVMFLFEDILTLALSTIYDQYTENSYGMWGQAITNVVLPLAFLIFSIFNVKKLDPLNSAHRIWFNAIVFYAFFNILALQIEMVERFGRFFASYALLLIPYIFSKVKNKNLRFLYMMVLMCVLILYNYIVLADSVFDPYYFIWDK